MYAQVVEERNTAHSGGKKWKIMRRHFERSELVSLLSKRLDYTFYVSLYAWGWVNFAVFIYSAGRRRDLSAQLLSLFNSTELIKLALYTRAYANREILWYIASKKLKQKKKHTLRARIIKFYCSFEQLILCFNRRKIFSLSYKLRYARVSGYFALVALPPPPL